MNNVLADPGLEARRRAVGPLEELPPLLQRAFTANDDFEPVPPPGRLDWLRVAPERGQSFARFVRGSPGRPDGARPVICLQPIGPFSRDQAALLESLQRFATAFFARPVRLLPPLTVDRSITTRTNRFTGVVQLKTRDLLPWLARHVPPDAYCVLGMTGHDLYAHDRWSFVFGEAIVDDRVAVCSFARYDPRFYGKADADPALLLRRTCKVVAHEICHMLGMRHCIYFNCLMNGSNHLAESDRRPLHLCPIDLRKAHWSLGFDVIHRYRELGEFWRAVGVTDEVQWIERRIEYLRDGS